MRTSPKNTLMASLIGSAAGTGAWLLGVGKSIWPDHPQMAVFLLTVVCTVALMQFWPRADAAKTKSENSN